jgi:hypothetical protein
MAMDSDPRVLKCEQNIRLLATAVKSLAVTVQRLALRSPPKEVAEIVGACDSIVANADTLTE